MKLRTAIKILRYLSTGDRRWRRGTVQSAVRVCSRMVWDERVQRLARSGD